MRRRGITRRDFVLRTTAAVGALSMRVQLAARQANPAVRSPRRTLIDDLVIANHILAQQGIVDGFGHVSVRDDPDANRFLLSRSLAPELVTADDILEFDLDGRTADRKGPGYAERFIHSEIYKARPDVKSIVHSHTSSVIPFGVTGVPLRPVFHMASFLGEGVPIFDIRQTMGDTDMLVSDAARGRELVKVLAAKPIVLMRGHGVVVVGSSIPVAVGRSIYLDANAKIQAQALALSGTITYLSPNEARAIMAGGENGGYQRAWEMWKKRATGK